MCGIFGTFQLTGSATPNRSHLDETARILGHRGPDNVGIHAADGIGLVHTRLSLLDLTEGANQPYWDRNRRYALVYNGEVYNFWELRRELEEAGHSFDTRCDTEVVLKGCIHFGVSEFVPRLEGMFAFALWDRDLESITLVRDRFGIKPLSILLQPDRLLFSSEIKGMRPWVDLSPNRDAVAAYLAGFGGPTRDNSFFQGVEILAPGSIVRVARGGDVKRTSFFSVPEFWDPERAEALRSRTPTQIVDELDELLSQSVERHLLADAPVGAFCSGGVDSSLVMAMAAKRHPNLAVFHADVRGPLSEYDAAARLASHLHLDMKTVEVTDEDFVHYLPEVMWGYESPYSYHPNSIPFLLVAKLVREHHVKAVLSGEGADECFLGYRGIANADLYTWFQRRLAGGRKLIRKVPRVGEAICPDEDDIRMTLGLLSKFEIELDNARTRDHVVRVSGPGVHPREYRSLNWLSYHLRTLLHRNDTLGMAASIEARFPYLDHDVVRFAVNMPYGLKIRRTLRSQSRADLFGRNKWALREVANRYLPKELSQRPKLGFPTNAYARTRISSDYFSRSTIHDHFRLSRSEGDFLFETARQDALVKLLFLDVWMRLFIEGESIAAVQSSLAGSVSVVPEAT